MSVTGKVVNGAIVLPPGTNLPEGAEVKVETVEKAVSVAPQPSGRENRFCRNQSISTRVELFEQRQDKEWSLTDCLFFVVMRDEGVTNALTGDRHFEQAGFAALLR